MNPLDPAELSAYLDGELSAERMREIERIVALDPTARAELESLAKLHARWQASARTAAFLPAVNLPSMKETRTLDRSAIAFLVLLVIAQIALRVFNVLALVLALEFLALVVVLTGVIALTASPGSAVTPARRRL
jgi:anti-sigma factor RsiW